MGDPRLTEGIENNNPAGNPNAGGDAPAMQSITAELERVVALAGNYTAYANYMNEVVQPLLLLLTTLLPDQYSPLAQGNHYIMVNRT